MNCTSRATLKYGYYCPVATNHLAPGGAQRTQLIANSFCHPHHKRAIFSTHYILLHLASTKIHGGNFEHTANVYRGLEGLYGKI